MHVYPGTTRELPVGVLLYYAYPVHVKIGSTERIDQSSHFFPTGSKTETVVHTQVYDIPLLFYYSMCITFIPNNFSIFKK